MLSVTSAIDRPKSVPQLPYNRMYIYISFSISKCSTYFECQIILIYFYITIYVLVPHLYDLSVLVGCWSSVSIRRIIYKFLNVCPFDCTAVAVSGKVERS